jgi:lysophospholipase L1-like esterase
LMYPTEFRFLRRTAMSSSFRITLAVAVIALAVGAGTSRAGLRAPTGTSPSLTLVALGDSIPYGQDCGGCTGYVDLYARAASHALGVPIKVDNRAEHNNLDSARLLAQVRHSRSMRAALRGASIITLQIGHNDTPWASSTDPCDSAKSDVDGHEEWASYSGPCLASIASKLRANVAGILREIKRLRGGKPTVIRVTNFHNDAINDPTMPEKSYAPSKTVDDALTTAICAAAASAKVPCADVYHAFNGPHGARFDGPYVSSDHVHPNQKGHNLIAALLAKFGYAPLHRS